MATPGWYNENSLRHYPLVADPTPVMQRSGSPVFLPTQAIVDIGIEIDSLDPLVPIPHAGRLQPIPRIVDVGIAMGSSAPTQIIDAPGPPDLTQIAVYLQSISRADPILSFTFGTTEPHLASSPLVFTRHINDAEWTTSDSVTRLGGTIWRGYLVTGPMAWLLALLPDGATLAGNSSLLLEPSTWRSIAGTYVRNIVVANYSRLVASTPGVLAPPYDPTIILGGDPLLGNVLLEEGYNLAIRQDDTEGTLTFSATVGGGEGTPCSEVRLYPDEQPPSGSQYLTGGPSCSEVISSINGQIGPSIKMLGVGGVSVITDPSNVSHIIVDLTVAAADAYCPAKPIARLRLVAQSPGVLMTVPPPPPVIIPPGGSALSPFAAAVAATITGSVETAISTSYQQLFDSVTPPALPLGWHSNTYGASNCFATTAFGYYTAPNELTLVAGMNTGTPWLCTHGVDDGSTDHPVTLTIGAYVISGSNPGNFRIGVAFRGSSPALDNTSTTFYAVYIRDITVNFQSSTSVCFSKFVNGVETVLASVDAGFNNTWIGNWIHLVVNFNGGGGVSNSITVQAFAPNIGYFLTPASIWQTTPAYAITMAAGTCDNSITTGGYAGLIAQSTTAPSSVFMDNFSITSTVIIRTNFVAT